MFSKYTDEAQRILLNSKLLAFNYNHDKIGSIHIFLSLLTLDNDFKELMYKYNITFNKFKDKALKYIKNSNNTLSYTDSYKRIIESSELISRDSKDYVNNNIIIYSLLDDNNLTVNILEDNNIDISKILDYYSHLITTSRKNNKKLTLYEYGIDLCEKVKAKDYDPIIGRDKEIKEIIEILLRKNKNNPLLVGEAGVGKTAIVEKLASMINDKQVPDRLLDKKIVSISLSSIVSNTKYRGEFEERLTKIINELIDNPNIILFIDEIHTIMGAGGAEGAIDASNILKPYLARNSIKLIGATTLNEFKKSIEKDHAMERRFQIVKINEITYKETYNILLKLFPIYSKYHNIKIDNNLIKNIIDLSNKYIINRKQPDKSIDILDLVCSKVSINNKKYNKKLVNYYKELNEYKLKKNRYILNDDYENAYNIKLKENKLLKKISNYKINNKNNIVSLKDIESVVSDISNIPIYHSVNDLNKLSNYIKKNMFGINKEIDELINITKRKRLCLNNDKPLSILLYGPIGIGKTKLAELYAKDSNLIRLDMSLYKDESSITKLLGSNKGYIGYDEANNVFEQIRTNPYSILLLEDIDLANSSIINIFSNILDKGEITDNKGNTISFKNTTIIMTTNIGLKNNIGFIDNCNNNYLKEYFNNSFINRINKIIYFNKLDNIIVKDIIKYKLYNIRKKYKENNIKLHIPNKYIDIILDKCNYKEYGCSLMDNIISDYIDYEIINNIINGKKDIYINI